LDESEVRTDSRESSWSPQRWRVFKDYEEKKVDVNVDKEKLEDEKIKVVLVDVGEAEAVVRAFKEKSDIQFDIFLDFEAEMSDAFGVVGVPTFYYVDEKGIVVNTDHSLPDDFNKPFQKSS